MSISEPEVADLLFEIGCEELPLNAIPELATQLQKAFETELEKRRLLTHQYRREILLENCRKIIKTAMPQILKQVADELTPYVINLINKEVHERTE